MIGRADKFMCIRKDQKMLRSNVLTMFAILLLTACDSSNDKKLLEVSTNQRSAVAAEAPVLDPANATVVEKFDDTSTAKLPSAQIILKDMFKQPVEGEIDQKLQDGRMASYWVGHQFSFKGKVYQVGYAISADTANEYPAPEEQVFVSSATYTLTDSASKLLNTQDKFAKFGAKAQAAAVRQNVKTETFEVGDNLLLAVPVRTLEMGGIEMQSSEIFSFSEANATWTYLGNIFTGQNDDANCTEGKTPNNYPCSSSTGSISILEKSASSFPDIKVIRSGTEIGADKKVRRLSGNDFFEFKFNTEKLKYEQSQK
jgi:hypothetical protein